MKIRILTASCCSAVVLCLAGLAAAQYGTSTSQKPEATPVAQIAPDTVQKIGPELVNAYNFQPYATSLPDHLWMKVDDNHMQFLHFQKPVNAPNNMLAFVGDGIRGRF
jgi:hypothetical protein